MSLRLLTARDRESYAGNAQWQAEVAAGNFVSWSGSGFAPPRFTRVYYDRFDQVYALSAGGQAIGGTSLWLRYDPLTLDTSVSGALAIRGLSGLSAIFTGEWNKTTGVQRMYGDNTISATGAIQELSPTTLAAIDTDAYPNLGVGEHRGSLTATDDGFYRQVGSTQGNWIFFETLGYAINPFLEVRASGQFETGVMAQVDLTTGAATIITDVPTRYTSGPTDFQAPQVAGQSFDLKVLQFAPDDDSTPAAPKGRFILSHQGPLTDPIDSSLDNIYSKIIEWNPSGLSGTPNRVHKREIFVSRMQLLENDVVGNGGIGNGSYTTETVVFHPGTNSYRWFFRFHGSGTDPDPSDITAITYSVQPAVFGITAASQLEEVETNKTVDFAVTVIGDVGEKIAGEPVEFSLQRASTVGENVGTGDGATNSFALDNAPIDFLDEISSITVAAVSYTPVAVGAAASGNEVEVDLSNGDLEFFVGGVSTPPPNGDVILASYLHPSTPATPGHGTLLTGLTRSDETGRAFAQVRYPDDSTLEDGLDQLDATNDV